MLTFEEDDPPEPLELAVKQVVSVVKSAQEKVNFSFVSVYFWAGNVNFSYQYQRQFYLSILLYL